MPTADQVRLMNQRRGLLLSSLWDILTETGNDWAQVTDALAGTEGLADLSETEIAAVVNGLIRDGLVQPVPNSRSMDDEYEPLLQLTAAGNNEVERWVTAPGTGTEHLPVPYNQTVTINSFNGPVSGSAIVSGSSNVTIHISAESAAELRTLAIKAFELLEQLHDSADDDREEITVDITTIQQTAAGQVEGGRARAALRRVGRWAAAAAQVGATGALSHEVQDLVTAALPHIN